MKKLLLIITLAFCQLSLIARSPAEITGKVMDENNEPLPFATILLLSVQDSSLVKANTTDMDGSYTFEDIKAGDFFIKATMVGFEEYLSSPIHKTEGLAINLPIITLKTSVATLDAVEVVARKPFIEQQLDKTVLNVENSIVGAGNTALEVLEKAPGVFIDRQNNQLKLRNKAGVLVMIDGRRNYMSEQSLMEYLNNMSSDQIESIELITNPSSKYDASGNSGIINIKLKKNKNYGTNGSLSLTGSNVFLPFVVKDFYAGSTNLSLNHRKEKWNVYGTANVGSNQWYNDNDIERTTNFEGTKSIFVSESKRFGKGNYINAKLGTDYYMSDKTTIGVMLDYNNWKGNMDNVGVTRVNEITNGNSVQSYLTPLNFRNNTNNNFTANFNIKQKLKKEGADISLDLDYSGYDTDATTLFDTKFYDQNNTQTDILLQRNFAPSSIDIYAGRIDLTMPFENKSKLELGVKSSFVKTDNNFIFEIEQDGTYVNDPGKTNHFLYDELVNAAYANYGKQWEKTGIQAGLRAEHTLSNGNSITLNKEVNKNYLSLFPTFFINHKLAKDHAVRLSYSRRIGRPNYSQLNPFIFFLDPYTFNKGNSFLTPQFTENLELAYTYKDGLTVSAGYGYTKDNIFETIEQNDTTRVTYQTTINLQHTNNYFTNVSLPIPVTKWWNLQSNFSLYYINFKDDNISGGQLNAGQLAYNFNINNILTLKKGWAAEVSSWYSSPQRMGIITTNKPQYAVNMGVQKNVLDGKGKFKLNANDIFLTSFFRGDINYANMDLMVRNRWASRRVTLNFTYNFGNQNVKNSRRRSTASDDMKNRVGGN